MSKKTGNDLFIGDISGLRRDELIRSTARELGHARTSPVLKAELDTAIRRAVRRGIAGNSGAGVGAVVELLLRSLVRAPLVATKAGQVLVLRRSE